MDSTCLFNLRIALRDPPTPTIGPPEGLVGSPGSSYMWGRLVDPFGSDCVLGFGLAGLVRNENACFCLIRRALHIAVASVTRRAPYVGEEVG